MNKPLFSFEFFPPQTPEGVEKLAATRKQLASLKPEFFSVTFGAGGSTQDRTLETIRRIKAEGYNALGLDPPYGFQRAVLRRTACTECDREKLRLERCQLLARGRELFHALRGLR